MFALASGMGRSAISVVRLSGPECGRILSQLCGRLPTPRVATLLSLRDQASQLLDRGLILWFPGPGSYTGEDSAELHLHGGRAVLEDVAGALLEHGAKPAGAGEFTRRAFVNGKIDLLEAEAIGDLVEAETQAQRVRALDQVRGSISRVVESWSERLTHALAWQEALIDFGEEEVPREAEEKMVATLSALSEELSKHLKQVPQGERLRRGLVFAIIGPPNAGKSSLLNALARQDVAIVSPCPGTTRDAVRVDVTFGGVPVTLVDTAGLRETDDPVEVEGMRRARMHAATADLVIGIVDAGGGSHEMLEDTQLVVANKIDLAPVPDGYLGISVLTGAGLPELNERLTRLARDLAHPSADPVFSRARHAAALRDAEAGVTAALNNSHPELRAEELRLALQALGRITGKVSSEAILDVIFGDFCIGK